MLVGHARLGHRVEMSTPRLYPDLAALRAALGGAVELRLVEDVGDDALLSAAFGQPSDRDGGYLLLLSHALYDGEGLWARVRTVGSQAPEALLGLWPVGLADRLGSVVCRLEARSLARWSWCARSTRSSTDGLLAWGKGTRTLPDGSRGLKLPEPKVEMSAWTRPCAIRPTGRRSGGTWRPTPGRSGCGGCSVRRC